MVRTKLNTKVLRVSPPQSKCYLVRITFPREELYATWKDRRARHLDRKYRVKLHGRHSRNTRALKIDLIKAAGSYIGGQDRRRLAVTARAIKVA